MTFHKVRAKAVNGHKPNGAKGHKSSPRLSVSFDPLVFKAIDYLSKKWDVPGSEVVRRGMLSYTTPLLYELAAGLEPNFSAGKRPG